MKTSFLLKIYLLVLITTIEVVYSGSCGQIRTVSYDCRVLNTVGCSICDTVCMTVVCLMSRVRLQDLQCAVSARPAVPQHCGRRAWEPPRRGGGRRRPGIQRMPLALAVSLLSLSFSLFFLCTVFSLGCHLSSLCHNHLVYSAFFSYNYIQLWRSESQSPTRYHFRDDDKSFQAKNEKMLFGTLAASSLCIIT